MDRVTRAQGVDGVPQWRVVGASVRGSGHEQSGAECQDAHAVDVTLGMMVVAVADGAGSARYAALGSAAAASAALDSVRAERALGLPQTESAWRDCLARVLDGARERLVQEAREHGAELREFATTLLVAVVTPELLVAAQVGDGAIVEFDDTTPPTALTRPERGEHVNETTFLTSEGAVEQAQYAFRAGAPRTLALFTDGLQRLALQMPHGTPHPPFFATLIDFMQGAVEVEPAEEELRRFLMSARVRERTDDDITLVLAHPCRTSRERA